MLSAICYDTCIVTNMWQSTAGIDGTNSLVYLNTEFLLNALSTRSNTRQAMTINLLYKYII